MIRPHRMRLVSSFLFLFACDGGKDAKPADAKPADAKPANSKQPDAKQPDAKQPDAKAPARPAAAPSFDVGKDTSGVLARSAAVIEASKAHDDASLRDLSHHAESLPSFETLCKHEVEVGKSEVAVPDCIKTMEHHLVQLGPEVYGQYAACIMDAKTVDAVAACDLAEQEAERILHAKPHGEALAKDVCEKFFVQFETLSMADAGDHAELVKEVLEEVRADVVTACQEQGTKAEVDCAMGAKTMTELNTCASKLL